MLDQNRFDPTRSLQISRVGVPRIHEVSRASRALDERVLSHANAIHGASGALPDGEALLQVRTASLRFVSWGRWQQAVEIRTAAERSLKSGEPIGVLSYAVTPEAEPERADDLIRAHRALMACLAHSAERLRASDVVVTLRDFSETGFQMMRANWPPAARARVLSSARTLIRDVNSFPAGRAREFGTVAAALLMRRLKRLTDPEVRAAVQAGSDVLDALVRRGEVSEDAVRALRVQLLGGGSANR